MVYSVKVLKDGYSYEKDGQYKANGTCTLILGPDPKELGMFCISVIHNTNRMTTGQRQTKMIVDTLSAWDKDILISALASEGLRPEDITHVVNTHGHPDHMGNNNLFTGPGVVHVMGHSIHTGDIYNTDIDFKAGDSYCIDGENLLV